MYLNEMLNKQLGTVIVTITKIASEQQNLPYRSGRIPQLQFDLPHKVLPLFDVQNRLQFAEAVLDFGFEAFVQADVGSLQRFLSVVSLFVIQEVDVSVDVVRVLQVHGFELVHEEVEQVGQFAVIADDET